MFEFWAVAAGAGLWAPGALGQITPTCVGSTFPIKPLVRPISDVNTAADLTAAAGQYRVIVFSNSGVRILCKAGFLTQNSQAELSGSNVNTALFTPTLNPGQEGWEHLWTVDPRVIYDHEDGLFWSVAAEWCFLNPNYKARLHIGASQAGPNQANDETPQSWSTDYWVKYTGDGPTGAAGPSFDLASNNFSPDRFADIKVPDNPRIAVDRDFLYTCIREGTVGGSFDQDKMLMVVMSKDDLRAGSPTIETSEFIDTGEFTQTSMHALAVDTTIPDSGTHRVYVVALFQELANENNMRADLDASQSIDTWDLIIMLNAIGEEP